MKYLVSLLSGICLFIMSYAQPPLQRLNPNSVVRDSGGIVYPYAIWQSMVMQGNYKLITRTKPGEEPIFFLEKMTEEEKLARNERMPKPGESEFFKVGKDFGNFKGSTMNNEVVNTKNEKGKILVINFWFINCPPCQKEIPELNEVVERFRGNSNVRFLAVALDQKPDLKNFLAGFPFNYEVLYNGRFISERFGIRAYPTHVMVDQQGKIQFSATGLGPGTVHWLRKKISELLTVEDAKM